MEVQCRYTHVQNTIIRFLDRLLLYTTVIITTAGPHKQTTCSNLHANVMLTDNVWQNHTMSSFTFKRSEASSE